MSPGHGEVLGEREASADVQRLREELEAARRQAHELRETRRAVLNLLEDLDDDRRRLARGEQEWRAAFDGIRDAMFTHDAQNRILRANRACLSLAGRPLEQVVGKPYRNVFPRFQPPLGEASRDEGMEEREVALGGEVFRSRSFTARDEAGALTVFLRVLENITEKKHAEEEIRRRSEELMAANRMLEKTLGDLKAAQAAMLRSERLATLGMLAAGVAHELNNPLMGVLNYVEYAREKMPDGKGRESLDKAERELRRLGEFAANLLLLGRAPGEALTPVRVEEAVDRALELLAADLFRRGVRVSRELPADLPRVWGSAAPLQQVLLNLLLNAMDAVAETEQKRICIKASADAERVRVVVADTGCGVSHAERLFEPFFTTKAEGQGTGLGLFISQGIIAGFGGTLELVPPSPPGASFAVTLRRVRQ